MTTCVCFRWLKRGSMFIFSRSQLDALLDIPTGWHWQAENMLDLGRLHSVSYFWGPVYLEETQWQLRVDRDGQLLLQLDDTKPGIHWSSACKEHDEVK